METACQQQSSDDGEHCRCWLRQPEYREPEYARRDDADTEPNPRQILTGVIKIAI